MSDRSCCALLFVCTLLVYGYFFQGYGFNQNAHFDTVRAMVERGTFEITPYVTDRGLHWFTGDVSFAGDRVYSSKPPGLALIIVPAYAVLYGGERAAGIDPASPRVVQINQYLCTVWGGALPGAILAIAMFLYFRRRRLEQSDAMLLAGGFALGSLMLPYTGMLVSETALATCLFLAWRWIDRAPTDGRSLAAGALLGLSLLLEISAAPLVVVYAILAWARRRRAVLFVLIGPIVALTILLVYQRMSFGGALASGYSRVNPYYIDNGLFLGRFNWPDLRRLYWLSFHPIRGLIYCCPIFFIPVLSMVSPGFWRGALRWRGGWIVPAAVVANFLLFELAFNGWTGGFGVGPRYLVPALPFLMVFAISGYRRFPRIATALIVLSICAMLAVTSVRAQWPTKSFGPPVGDNPVADSLRRLTFGDVAEDPGSFNLGQLMGLKHLWSLLPVIGVIAVWGLVTVRLRGPRRSWHVGWLIAACACLLGTFAACSLTAVRTKSPTMDEPVHALAAWLWLNHHDYRLDPEDPPLWGYWMALPNGPGAIHADFNSPAWRKIPALHWGQTPWWRHTLYGTAGNDAERLVQRSRVMALVIGVLLGALAVWWAYALAGAPASILVAVFYCFDPNFLAHSPLVKNDVAISLLLLGAAMATWHFGRQATIFRALLIGVICGGAMSTKFSGVLALPIVALLLQCRAWGPVSWWWGRRELTTRRRRAAFAIVVTVLCGIIAYGVIWASYGFRYSATGDPSTPMNNRLQAAMVVKARLLLAHPDQRPTAAELASTPPGAMVDVMLWLSDHKLMPEAWVNGFLYTYHTSLIRPAYLLGEIRSNGWWYYFPLAMLFKTPLATLAMLAIAAIAAMWQIRTRTLIGSRWDWQCLLLPPAVYFGIAMTTNLNLGIRHVLPVYPPVYIAAGLVFAGAWRFRPRAAGWLAGIGAIVLAVESLSVWPNYIAFFNVASGGSRGGIRLLGDSNLDWGQDLVALRRWQLDHPDTPLYLDYFGSMDPAIYVHARPFDPSTLKWPSGPGVLAVSATNLQGIYLPPSARDFYRRQWNQRPLTVLGGSIYLFDLGKNNRSVEADPTLIAPSR